MIRGVKPRLLVLAGCLLLGLALVAMLPRGSVENHGEQVRRSGSEVAATSKVSTAGDRRTMQTGTLPADDWEAKLRRYKARNRQELEQRLALLDERVGLSQIKAINLRHHMEGWYDSWEKEVAKNQRWSWPDHREIIWSRICGSLFGSGDQADAYRELTDEIEHQRGRNRASARELMERFKQRTDVPPHLDNLMVPFLEAWQTSAQGVGKREAEIGEMPWRDGLRSGDFDPLSDLLDSAQLAGFRELIEDTSGAAIRQR